MTRRRGRPETLFSVSGRTDCTLCGAKGAVVELPPAVRAEQPDDTTHVCHPGLGGCNHGFAAGPDKSHS